MSAEGRTLTANQKEMFCKLCKEKVKGLDVKKWYFYDNKYDKGLYCEDCAKHKELSIDENNQYWLVDKFKPKFEE